MAAGKPLTDFSKEAYDSFLKHLQNVLYDFHYPHKLNFAASSCKWVRYCLIKGWKLEQERRLPKR